MKWISESNTLELTARNVAALITKLDDPHSARMLRSGDGQAIVLAVESAEGAKVAAAATEGVVAVMTRAQLVQLATEGASVIVAGVAVRSVPDAAHYNTRPSGVVFSPSTGQVTEPNTEHWRLHHICEVCGVDQILTAAEAFDAGWDYPPRMGAFGVIGPRSCPRCPMSKTVWWALMMDGVPADALSDAQRDTLARILAEPMSIEVEDELQRT